jgi:hypothetical protein
MKKKVQKLQLCRETLHQLMLTGAVGGNPSIYPYCSNGGYCTVTCAGTHCTGAVCN